MRQGNGSRASKRAMRILLLALAVQTTGCYTYHVYQIGGVENREAGNQPATEWRYKTLHGFAWGLSRQDLPVDNCKLGNGQRLGIEEVKIEKPIGYMLASAVTLGAWMPIKVGWRCAKPPVGTGILRDGEQ